jgi:hypothetical protein
VTSHLERKFLVTNVEEVPGTNEGVFREIRAALTQMGPREFRQKSLFQVTGAFAPVADERAQRASQASAALPRLSQSQLTEQQLERVRVQGGRVYVVGLQGQVLWRPEP